MSPGLTKSAEGWQNKALNGRALFLLSLLFLEACRASMAAAHRPGINAFNERYNFYCALGILRHTMGHAQSLRHSPDMFI
jgi:hypothetical protein